MNFATFLSDDEVLDDAAAFEAASGPDSAIYAPLQPAVGVDAAMTFLMYDSAFLDTVPIEADSNVDMAALTRKDITASKNSKQRDMQLGRKEKNRLKQAAYRQKLKVPELAFDSMY